MIRELNVYQHEAHKYTQTFDGDTLKQKNIAFMGIASEGGEVLDLQKKLYAHGKAFTIEQLKEELGDVLWNLAELCTLHGFTLADVAEYQLQKMKKRHGDTYNRSYYTPSGSYIDDAGTHFTQ